MAAVSPAACRHAKRQAENAPATRSQRAENPAPSGKGLDGAWYDATTDTRVYSVEFLVPFYSFKDA